MPRPSFCSGTILRILEWQRKNTGHHVLVTIRHFRVAAAAIRHPVIDSGVILRAFFPKYPREP